MLDNRPQNELSRRERKQLKRIEKREDRAHSGRTRFLKRALKIVFGLIILFVAVGGLVWFIDSQPAPAETDIISKTGIHWHPHLSVFIKGQKQEIAEGIGLGGVVHETIHTHDNSGTLHLEFPGLVTKDDTKLGRFFRIWGKKFDANCVFDFCNGNTGNLKMTVNGAVNHDFENYLMHDGDQIEIRFE